MDNLHEEFTDAEDLIEKQLVYQTSQWTQRQWTFSGELEKYP